MLLSLVRAIGPCGTLVVILTGVFRWFSTIFPTSSWSLSSKLLFKLEPPIKAVIPLILKLFLSLREEDGDDEAYTLTLIDLYYPLFLLKLLELIISTFTTSSFSSFVFYSIGIVSLLL